MNDSVLRGFCKRCGRAVELHKLHVLDDSPDDYKASHIENTPIRCTQTDPVWFLSAEQMDIITKWYDEQEMDDVLDFQEMLRKEPFLVAKILKEAEKEAKV